MPIIATKLNALIFAHFVEERHCIVETADATAGSILGATLVTDAVLIAIAEVITAGERLEAASGGSVASLRTALAVAEGARDTRLRA